MWSPQNNHKHNKLRNMSGVSNIDMILKIAHLLAVSSMYPSIAKKKNLQIIDPKQQLTNDAKNCLERSFREALKKMVNFRT